MREAGKLQKPRVATLRKERAKCSCGESFKIENDGAIIISDGHAGHEISYPRRMTFDLGEKNGHQ